MLPSPKRKRNIAKKIIVDPSWVPGENPQHHIVVPKNNFKEFQVKFMGIPRRVKLIY